MLTPNTNTLWRYRGQGQGHGDIQRVVWADYSEVVTVTETRGFHRNMWSWLGSMEEFPKFFMYVGPAPIGPRDLDNV